MNDENRLVPPSENIDEQPEDNTSDMTEASAPEETDEQAAPPSGQDAPAPDERISELKELVLAASNQLDELSRELSYATKLAEKKQEQVDKLYEENRAYKDDLVEQFKTKLVLGVVEQLDRADKQVRTFEEKEESEKTYRNLLESFRELTEEFREMLQNRFDISCFRTGPGLVFDPKRHKALGTVPTEDPEKDKTVAQSRRYGYENADGRILRQEFVEVYCYDPSSRPEASNDPGREGNPTG